MGYADLHVHTTYSFDSTTTVRAVLKQAADEGLDVIAITDHDEVRGALEGRELASKFGIEVLPGVEISTSQGHVLAFFIEKNPPWRIPFLDTLLWVADQGGIAVVAHPFAPLPESASLEVVLHTLQHPVARKALKGIEVHNASLRALNARAEKLSQYLPLARTGGSDAHVYGAIGTGRTFFPGQSVHDLHVALEKALTIPVPMRKYSIRYLLEWTRRFALRHLRGYASDTLSANLPIRTQPVFRTVEHGKDQ